MPLSSSISGFVPCPTARPHSSSTMKPLTLALALFCTARPSLAAFCNYFSTGPVANGTFIRTANATLVIPPHSPKTGLLSLWTGMGTSNGDLIQALVESYNGSAYAVARQESSPEQRLTATRSDTGCGVLPKQDWCAYSSTLSVNGKKQGGHVSLADSTFPLLNPLRQARSVRGRCW